MFNVYGKEKYQNYVYAVNRAKPFNVMRKISNKVSVIFKFYSRKMKIESCFFYMYLLTPLID